MSKQETVEVTLRFPRSFLEFLKAIHKLSRVETSLEDWCVQYLIDDIMSSVKGSGVDETFEILGRDHLIKAYNLNEVWQE